MATDTERGTRKGAVRKRSQLTPMITTMHSGGVPNSWSYAIFPVRKG